MTTCTICKRPFEQHAITGEWTCFSHGNPNGSEFERNVHAQALLREGKHRMARKRTGLRNRYRSGGTGTYSTQRKSREADRYGEYRNRSMLKPDIIAGRTMHATRDPAE
jgi:hypothetical protein